MLAEDFQESAKQFHKSQADLARVQNEMKNLHASHGIVGDFDVEQQLYKFGQVVKLATLFRRSGCARNTGNG